MLNVEVKEDSLYYDTWAYFYVSEFKGEASEVTQKLELEPAKTWQKGDVWFHQPRLRPESNWQIHSPVNRSEIFLNVHIEALLDIIEPKIAKILELKEQGCNIGINCVGYYYDTHPGFQLSAELLTRLAALSLDVDFDLYCLCADDD
jgi:hypothetical protein